MGMYEHVSVKHGVLLWFLLCGWSVHCSSLSARVLLFSGFLVLVVVWSLWWGSLLPHCPLVITAKEHLANLEKSGVHGPGKRQKTGLHLFSFKVFVLIIYGGSILKTIQLRARQVGSVSSHCGEGIPTLYPTRNSSC